MTTSTWQRSSYCAQGEACIHVAAHHNTINVIESGDPTGATLHTTPRRLGRPHPDRQGHRPP